jgi:hypothetical protein
MTQSLQARWLAKVDVNGPILRLALGRCWIWTGARDRKGYGRLGGGGRGAVELGAHRVGWSLENGQIPEGKWVLHKCDNPPCVRASHLYLGDHEANMRDVARRGRQASERNPLAKFTYAWAQELRAFAQKSDLSLVELAAKFGTDPGKVSRVLRHKLYAKPPNGLSSVKQVPADVGAFIKQKEERVKKLRSGLKVAR